VPLPQAWEFVGYDGAGTQVAQLDLVSLHRRASPHPLVAVAVESRARSF